MVIIANITLAGDKSVGGVIKVQYRERVGGGALYSKCIPAVHKFLPGDILG